MHILNVVGPSLRFEFCDIAFGSVDLARNLRGYACANRFGFHSARGRKTPGDAPQVDRRASQRSIEPMPNDSSEKMAEHKIREHAIPGDSGNLDRCRSPACSPWVTRMSS